MEETKEMKEFHQAHDDRDNAEDLQPPLDVLLIGPGTTEMLELEANLREVGAGYRASRVQDLQQALEVLLRRQFEILMFDLSLPHSPWRGALEQLANAAPQALRIGLSGSDDDQARREAKHHGAHDTATLSRLDRYWLPRMLDSALQLQHSERAQPDDDTHLGAMSDALPIGTLIVDLQGNYRGSNAVYRKICCQSARQMSGGHWVDVLHPQDRSRVHQEWKEAFENHASCHIESRVLRPDNSISWVSINAARLPVDRGYIHTVEDITERKHDDHMLRAAEEALYIEKERAQVTLNSIGDAVISTDIDYRVTFLNRVAEEMTGWNQESALGRLITEVFCIVDETSRQSVNDPARRAIEEDRIVGLAMGTILIGRDDREIAIEDSAAPIHDRDGEVTGAVIVFHHASQSLVVSNRMSHLAQHDALTGLPNRVLLKERLERAIGLAQRHRQQVGVMFIDIDAFKPINDRLGHATGDSLLQAVAGRLKGCVRDTDTVCRLGGDEFVILLTEIHGINDARQVAKAIFKTLQPTHCIGEESIDITVSMGISLYPEDGITPDELIHRADIAMYKIKRQARGDCTDDMLNDDQPRLSCSNDTTQQDHTPSPGAGRRCPGTSGEDRH
ncbi:MAG: diguanylate cyclase domain-containing protein [Pseudomonadota bacterium]